MSVKDALRILLEEKYDKLFTYSANYTMTKPKIGYEVKFTETKEIISVLEDLIKDLEGEK